MYIYQCLDRLNRNYALPLEVGLEIEMEVKAPLPMPTGKPIWGLVSDGSLRGRSNGEYVLRYPVPREELSDRLDQLVALLSIHKVNIGPVWRAGVHLHYNYLYKTERQTVNTILVYTLLEHVLGLYAGEDRLDNLFCLPATSAEALIEALGEWQETNNIYVFSDNRYKYSAVNPSSLLRHGSLEFRALQTPKLKEFYKILEWANIIGKVVDYGSELTSSQELITKFSEKGPLSLAQDILGEHFEVVALDLDFLVEGMHDRMRLIQFVAFQQSVEPEKLAPPEIHNENNRYMYEMGLDENEAYGPLYMKKKKKQDGDLYERHAHIMERVRRRAREEDLGPFVEVQDQQWRVQDILNNNPINDEE